MSHITGHLRETLAADSVLCSGAGNYGLWAQRFHRYRGFGTQLAPVSGSMGYGLPAAVAAALRTPEREVVCLAGDGCFQMTSAEFGTAAERGLKIIVLVCDNAAYGTIRMHQERAYPGRVSATNLVNPDFARWAQSYGAHAATVEDDKDFAAAFAAAREVVRAKPGPALLHLKLDVRDLAPGKTLGG
ncbi:MAG: thiamine pyrophosphate-dependent enzyme [Rhodospirillales bacterium]